MELEADEQGIVAMMRLNKAMPKRRIVKRCRIGRLEIEFKWRSKKNLWGRFGGGWNWRLGLQAGGRTMILYLVTFSLFFSIVQKPATEKQTDA